MAAGPKCFDLTKIQTHETDKLLRALCAAAATPHSLPGLQNASFNAN
jgi:hypothetical protein